MASQIHISNNYEVNEGFRFQNDYLFCEGIRVSEILGTEIQGEKISSPVFVYSTKQIKRNIQMYKSASDHRFVICYSVKANMNPSLLRLMKKEGLSLTLVSGLELKLALELGFLSDTLVMNGNGKMDWEVRDACKANVLLNIDSAFNMKQTIRICEEGNCTARVLLRINPHIHPDVHKYVATGQEGSKFGIAEEEMSEVLHLASNSKYICVEGLHCHIGSTVSNINTFKESSKVLIEKFKLLKERFFPGLRILNLGGGLAIPYKEQIQIFPELRVLLETEIERFQKTCPEIKRHYNDLLQKRVSLGEFLNCLRSMSECKCVLEILQKQVPNEVTAPSPQELVSSISDLIPEDVTVILEPGRSIIGNSAILLSSVIGTKTSSSKRYIITDGAMTEVIRPCLYNAYHHIELAEPSNIKSETTKYDVVGPVCESSDFLGKDRFLVTPHEGCRLAMFDVGAYCSSMSSNYNMRPRPAEILVDGDRMSVIRRRDTYEDLIKQFDLTNL